jgi:hypothetical protein
MDLNMPPWFFIMPYTMGRPIPVPLAISFVVKKWFEDPGPTCGSMPMDISGAPKDCRDGPVSRLAY